VTDEVLLREPLADGRSYPVAVSAESLVLDLAELDLRKYPETPDADSVCNIAVNRPLATWLQARRNQPAQRLIPTGVPNNNLWMTKLSH
jgi:nitrogenase molybdenum-iron protein alpha/beta subunit